jgi:hypothetical protein
MVCVGICTGSWMGQIWAMSDVASLKVVSFFALISGHGRDWAS